MTKPITNKSKEPQWLPEEPEQFFPTQHLKISETSDIGQLLVCECRNCLSPLSIEVIFITPQNSKPRLKSSIDSEQDNKVQCPNCGRVPLFMEGCSVKSIVQLPSSPWE